MRIPIGAKVKILRGNHKNKISTVINSTRVIKHVYYQVKNMNYWYIESLLKEIKEIKLL